MRPMLLASIAILSLAPVAPAAAQASSTPAQATAADAADQQIRCRRIPITGSLVRVERVCKTVAEWRRLSDRGNDVARQQVENGAMCSGAGCGGGR